MPESPLRNSYFVLRLDFSCVDSTGTTEEIRLSLYDHDNSSMSNFEQTYRAKGFDLPHIEIDRANALFSIHSLVSAAQIFGLAVYLLIDEYDNFASTLWIRNPNWNVATRT